MIILNTISSEAPQILLNPFKSLIHFPLPSGRLEGGFFILLPSPFGEGSGVRLFLLPSGRLGGGFGASLQSRSSSTGNFFLKAMSFSMSITVETAHSLSTPQHSISSP